MDDTLIFGPDRPSLWHILQQTDHFLSRHLRQHIPASPLSTPASPSSASASGPA